jgi:hypothetical protein
MIATLFVARRFGALRAMAFGFLCALPLSASASVAFALAGLLSGLLFPFGAMLAEGAATAAVGVWAIYAMGLSGILSLFPEAMLGAVAFFPLASRLEGELAGKEKGTERSRPAEMIGTMAMVINMYTFPISNFRKSALRRAAIRIGRVFLLLSEITNAGIK